MARLRILDDVSNLIQRQGQPGDARGDDRYDALPRELFYEQISKIGFDCLQRPDRNPHLIAEYRFARGTPHQQLSKAKSALTA